MKFKLNGTALLAYILIICFMLSGCTQVSKDNSKNEGSATDNNSLNTVAESQNGKHINISMLGISEWVPSKVAGEMTSEFTKYAKDKYGYDVSFTYQEASFGSLYNKAASSLASRSSDFNLIISDSQWLGSFAEPGWIVQLNDVIKNNPELGNIELYDPVVKSGYMTYPDGTDDLWGLPLEGDIIVLYVRKDMLENPLEQSRFMQKYGFELPQSYEDFIDITMDDFQKIAEFFTRPEEGFYGTALEYSREYDYFSGYLYPFIWSTGGEIWDASTGQIYGILNTDNNARALQQMVKLLDYNPPDAINFGIDEVVSAFADGHVFSAFQWAAMGEAVISPELKDKVLVVPPPCFMVNNKKQRIYSLGGQSWVINKFNNEDQMQVTIDFLKWWYLPETQMEFARRGGNPITKEVLNSQEFESMKPWYKAYKYMLTEERARDFWHDPKYSEMLAIQQAAFLAYATGIIKDPKKALDYAAYQQQKSLYRAGRTDIAPPDIDVGSLK